MKKSSLTFKVGTRGSKLALKQTGNALERLEFLFPAANFQTRIISTPGDRDHQQDLRQSAPDFFTHDLDQAMLNGEIDGAVHSAKDLPEPISDGLDFFWLPWHEDPRDVIVLRPDKPLEDLPGNPVIGISSDRREEYCRQHYPDAEQRSIRGNIDERIAQLDSGKFDILIMAAAGLLRLGLENRISKYIPLHDLPSPSGQGYLALTFRQGDHRFETMRQLFIKPVLFVGSGPGNPELITIAGLQALKNCDLCLYDALSPVELLENLPREAKAVFV